MDYYTTLGVSKNASPEEIKAAYRKLAAKHHPDRGGDTATFQKIQEAYDTLGTPDKKQNYDNPNQGFNNFGGFPGGFSFHAEGFNVNDLFGQFFRQNNPFQQRTQIFRTAINVTLEDAYKGASHVLQLQTPTGPKVINIEIPRGVDNSTQLRFDNIIDGGTLLVEFRVLDHLRFDRKGNDLYSNHKISVLDLIVGGTFKFSTISGKTVEVDVKPKTQPYMQLRIPGEGMPVSGTPMFGDQIIILKPYIPDTIDEAVIDSILNSRRK